MTRRTRQRLLETRVCRLVVICFLSLFLVIRVWNNTRASRDISNESGFVGEVRLADALPLYIVYATPWFGQMRRGANDEYFKKFSADNCPFPEEFSVLTSNEPWCLFTHNRSKTQLASALVFHIPSFGRAELPARKAQQPWIADSMESPANYKVLQSETMKLFNYSMTYRLDSDFPIPYFSPLNTLRDLSQPLPNRTFSQRRSLAAGQAPILWLASNCGASNHRTEFVAELRRHIPVDCLGTCLRNGPKTLQNKTVKVMSQYKFYLALENSNCKDYVTEKLHRALQAGVVPIVSGPLDQEKPDLGYRSFAPSRKSFIYADDFVNPGDLAHFVAQVERNESEWLSFLDYRGDPSHLSHTFRNIWGEKQYDWGHCGVCRNAARRVMGTDLTKLHVEPDNTCKKGHRMGYASYE